MGSAALLLFVVVAAQTPPALDAEAKAFVDAYCLKCHSAEKPKAKLR